MSADDNTIPKRPVVQQSSCSLTKDNTPWSHHKKLISTDYFELLLPQMKKFCQSYYTMVYGKKHLTKRISCIFAKPIKNDINDNSKQTDNNNNQDLLQEDKYYKGNIPMYSITSSDTPKELGEIWDLLEEKFDLTFDYVLVHIYRDHQDYIGWHNDKEALNSSVVSVSLGATRKFRFRPINETKGHTDELTMESGDVIHMHGPDPESENDVLRKGCQQTYKHYVPPMSVSDMKDHLIKQGVLLPSSGRLTKDILVKLMEKYDAFPVRINLTFRKHE